MVEINELRNNYNDLYRAMLKYSWDFTTINVLADLEVSVYTTFPDVAELERHLSRLWMCISRVALDDEDMKEAYDTFKETLDNDDEIYVKLARVQEVIQQ